jgi:hypothetical protein
VTIGNNVHVTPNGVIISDDLTSSTSSYFKITNDSFVFKDENGAVVRSESCSGAALFVDGTGLNRTNHCNNDGLVNIAHGNSDAYSTLFVSDGTPEARGSGNNFYINCKKSDDNNIGVNMFDMLKVDKTNSKVVFKGAQIYDSIQTSTTSESKSINKDTRYFLHTGRDVTVTLPDTNNVENGTVVTIMNFGTGIFTIKTYSDAESIKFVPYHSGGATSCS